MSNAVALPLHVWSQIYHFILHQEAQEQAPVWGMIFSFQLHKSVLLHPNQGCFCHQNQ